MLRESILTCLTALLDVSLILELQSTLPGTGDLYLIYDLQIFPANLLF